MITDGNENGTQQSYHDSVLIEFYLILVHYIPVRTAKQFHTNIEFRRDGNTC